jgi:DNA-directed RNA polymerase specialized sigma24 family protein
MFSSTALASWPTDRDLQRLRRIGFAYGRRTGLLRDDAEDCGAAFVVLVLERPERFFRPQFSPEHNKAFLHRCARNFALNFRRALKSCSSRETPPQAELLVFIPGDPLIATELWELIEQVVSRLRPEQQQLFWQSFHNEEDAGVLASALGCSANAIRCTLARIRKQCQRILERRGITESELRTYLCQSS